MLAGPMLAMPDFAQPAIALDGCNGDGTPISTPTIAAIASVAAYKNSLSTS
jgi:hypothetical protein